MLVRLLNRYLVCRRHRPSRWPRSNKCWRGTSMPASVIAEFFVGLQYRVPFILAFSFAEDTALDFAVRSADSSSGSHIPVLFEEEFDNPDDYWPPCSHVNFLEHSLVPGEKEFLHTGYSAFQVIRVEDFDFGGLHGKKVKLH